MADETNSERLSARTTASNYKKLVRIAKAKGWMNAKGKPNLSAVINFLIEQFDASKLKRRRRKIEKLKPPTKKKTRRKKRG
jgi:hypothetical protein